MRRTRHSWLSGRAGLTLLEVLIAITLLSVIAVGMLMAMRVGLDGLHKANNRLMDNRRVSGAQRVLEQQIGGFLPVKAVCNPELGGIATRVVFFQGEPQAMRFVSTYSLQDAWRGAPRILELLVIPGAEGRGVRLIVNELPYTGEAGAGQLCTGVTRDPLSGLNVPEFRPILPGPQSFVLADKLAWCRFSYLKAAKPPLEEEAWRTDWPLARWPAAIRVDMAPIEDNPSRLRPLTVTAPIQIQRAPDISYVDY
ncbi:MAG: prepilin-type N-terminal cleavage/methylation domain-containing protein [Bryobacteraceae bacterium]